MKKQPFVGLNMRDDDASPLGFDVRAAEPQPTMDVTQAESLPPPLHLPPFLIPPPVSNTSYAPASNRPKSNSQTYDEPCLNVRISHEFTKSHNSCLKNTDLHRES